MAFVTTIPHAYMGFGAQILIAPTVLNQGTVSSTAFNIRASNFGVQLKQDQTFPDLIDGIAAKSAYALGVKQVEGDISFPLMHEGTTAEGAVTNFPTDKTGGAICGGGISTSLAYVLWLLAAQRDQYGRMANGLDIGAIYPDNSQIIYPGCMVNTLSMKVTQGGPVDVTFGVIGGAYAGVTRGFGITSPTYSNTGTSLASLYSSFVDNSNLNSVAGTLTYLSPSRIVTWNDFNLMINSAGTTEIQDGKGVREFTVNLKNNIERFPTLNGTLAPQDITPKKREINGAIKLLGRHDWLNYWGETNETRFTSDEHMAFGYKIGANYANSTYYWATALHGLIFKIEEMTISPAEVFETTVNYEALGDCSAGYDSTEKGIGSVPATLGLLNNPQGKGTSGIYGATTFPTPALASPFAGWVDPV